MSARLEHHGERADSYARSDYPKRPRSQPPDSVNARRGFWSRVGEAMTMDLFPWTAEPIYPDPPGLEPIVREIFDGFADQVAKK